MGDKESQEDKRDAILHGLGESLDINTFSQILEMDDDETDREFSRSIVYGFFEQAESTMEQMKSAMEEKDLPKLSSQGHFLKGSAATLGLTVIQEACEKIQRLGHCQDPTGTESREPDYCLEAIESQFKILGDEFAVTKKALKAYFEA